MKFIKVEKPTKEEQEIKNLINFFKTERWIWIKWIKNYLYIFKMMRKKQIGGMTA